MLRRLRQPENLALIVACAALFYALLVFHAVSIRQNGFWYETGISYVYEPVKLLSETVSTMFFIMGICFLIMLVGKARLRFPIVIMFIALCLVGMAAVNNIFPTRHSTKSSIDVHGKTYQLIASHVEDGSYADETYLVVTCDSFNVWCKSIWISPTYGGVRSNLPIPDSARIEFASPTRLIVHLDDETFEIPLEP